MNDSRSVGKLRSRENCFDFLRLFAAVAVVIGHSTHFLGIPFLWLQPDSSLWFRDGVSLFFILSGMLIFRSAERCEQDGRPWRQFYANRLLRVAPAIYFYLLVTTVLMFAFRIIPVTQIGSPQFLTWFASTVMLIPVYHPSQWEQIGAGEVNGSLWTIPVECSFYVIVPLLAILAKKVGVVKMLSFLASVAVSTLVVAWLLNVPRSEWIVAKFYNITLFPYLCFFGYGIFWAKYWDKAPKGANIAMLSAVLYLLGRTTMSGFNEESGFLAYAGVVVWGIPFSYLAVWIGFNGPRVLSQLTNRIGDLSFGVYIWHLVIINVVLIYGIDDAFRGWSNPLIHLLILSASLVMASISWHLVESRALRLKPFTSRATSQRSESLSPGETMPLGKRLARRA